VAERLVDRLKTVEVDEENGEALAESRRSVERHDEALLEDRPIR
jgi:hypothetical protein